MTLDHLQNKIGSSLGIESYLYAGEYLRQGRANRSKLPIPEAKFYYRGPKTKIIPLSEPGLWLPLSCAITFVISTKAQSTTGNDVATAAGDFSAANFIAVIAASTTVDGLLIDSSFNTWAPLTANGTNPGCRLYYSENAIVSASQTFSYLTAGQFPSIIAGAFAGVATSSSFDQQNGGEGSGDTFQPGSITPGQDNEVVICGIGFANPGTTVTINGSFTIDNQQGGADSLAYGSGFAHWIQTTATATNPTWSFSVTTGGCASSIASFKIPAAGGVTIKQLAALGVG